MDATPVPQFRCSFQKDVAPRMGYCGIPIVPEEQLFLLFSAVIPNRDFFLFSVLDVQIASQTYWPSACMKQLPSVDR